MTKGQNLEPLQEDVVPFKTLISGLIRNERDYICIRAMGMSQETAKQLLVQMVMADAMWHPELEPHIVELENQVERNDYSIEAERYFSTQLSIAAKLVLRGVISKGFKWDKLEDKDQGRVLQACNTAINMTRNPSRKTPEKASVYEEWIGRVRRKPQEEDGEE